LETDLAFQLVIFSPFTQKRLLKQITLLFSIFIIFLSLFLSLSVSPIEREREREREREIFLFFSKNPVGEEQDFRFVSNFPKKFKKFFTTPDKRGAPSGREKEERERGGGVYVSL